MKRTIAFIIALTCMLSPCAALAEGTIFNPSVGGAATQEELLQSIGLNEAQYQIY